MPRNADAGVPWDPYQDTTYAREDLDILEIVKKEREAPVERPVLDAVRDLQEDPDQTGAW